MKRTLLIVSAALFGFAPSALADYGNSTVTNTIRSSWGTSTTVADIDINEHSYGSRHGVESSFARKSEWYGTDNKKSWVKGDIHTGSDSLGYYREGYNNTAIGNVRTVSEESFDTFGIEASGF
ncbi:MAG: hypothetical protein ACFCU8_01915 [Thermosynechococcaceae cyanobacterium]